MKKLFLGLILALVGSTAMAGASVSIREPAGLYAPGDITLDAPGKVVWNSAAIDTFSKPYVAAGACQIDYNTGGYHPGTVPVGFTCATPGTVHITTTGQLTSTCAYDGAILESLHLTLSLDGAVFYDRQLWPNPITCYVTPAQPAVATFSAPYVYFDNSTVSRPSASTTIYVNNPAWLYSKHTFTADGNATCGPYLLNVGTRFKRVMKEVGFTCTGVVPASDIITVAVQ